MKRFSVIAAFFFLSSSVYADMQSNLDSAFKSLGMSGNVTKGGGYQDQTGGFYTGGSIFARSKVNTMDLYSLQLPHYKSGCGGIDLFLGGMSFINAKEFIQMLRSIGNSAAGYAFNLALSTVTPQIKSVLDELSATVQKHTNMSVSSCEAAATLVGGVWPQSDASSQLLCNAMSKDLGLASDWTQSRQKCGSQGKRGATNARRGESRAGAYKDILGDEYNLAWKAIQKNGFLSSDVSLAQFFMTISGTIVSRKSRSDHFEMQTFPSKSQDPELIAGLVRGGRAVKVYKCDDAKADKCLSPSLRDITLSENNALYGKVHQTLLTITQKIREDTKLSDSEKGFINATKIPILRILAVETAFKSGGSPIHLTEFSEAIAHDILLQYLEEIVGIVWDSTTQLRKTQINDHLIKEFIEGLRDSRGVLFAKRTQMFEQMAITLDLIERTQQIEAKMQNMFLSYQQGSKAWSK